MIDLHSHVLPGIDDGPADLAGSVVMAQVAAETGTQRLVATPHLREDHPAVRPRELGGRVAELNAILARQHVDLEVLSGAEVDLSAALELDDDQLRLGTLAANGTDLLIETPHGPIPSIFEGLLGRVRARGFRVTLAHPELNPTFQAEPERLARLAADGVLLQITARSLRPARRSRSRALAVRAVEEGWCHVLASDAHAADWRPPRLGVELAEAQERMPALAERLHWMTHDAPAAILAGAPLGSPTPIAGPRRRGLFARRGR